MRHSFVTKTWFGNRLSKCSFLDLFPYSSFQPTDRIQTAYHSVDPNLKRNVKVLRHTYPLVLKQVRSRSLLLSVVIDSSNSKWLYEEAQIDYCRIDLSDSHQNCPAPVGTRSQGNTQCLHKNAFSGKLPWTTNSLISGMWLRIEFKQPNPCGVHIITYPRMNTH